MLTRPFNRQASVSWAQILFHSSAALPHTDRNISVGPPCDKDDCVKMLWKLCKYYKFNESESQTDIRLQFLEISHMGTKCGSSAKMKKCFQRWMPQERQMLHHVILKLKVAETSVWWDYINVSLSKASDVYFWWSGWARRDASHDKAEKAPLSGSIRGLKSGIKLYFLTNSRDF